jgi:hypothetical protein
MSAVGADRPESANDSELQGLIRACHIRTFRYNAIETIYSNSSLNLSSIFSGRNRDTTWAMNRQIRNRTRRYNTDSWS